MSITPVYLSIKTINYTDYAGLPVIVLGDGVPPSPVLREFCSVDARILPQDNGCIFLFKAEKESLPGNRKFNLATFRPIRSHAVELRYIFKE
jgi:hypothetical protein